MVSSHKLITYNVGYMYRGSSISIVIPCFNEEIGIRNVLQQVPSYIDQVVVVDNNSTDNSASVARSLGATVVTETNQGYGAAYKRGLPQASGEIIVTLDGDDTYPVHEITGLLDFMLDNNSDFISASRFPLAHNETMKVVNRLGNYVLTHVTRVLFGVKIKDSQSGMWIFKRTVLEHVIPESDGMAFSEEIKINAVLSPHVTFHEKHINYQNRIGNAKLNVWGDGFLNLVFLFNKRFRT